MIICLSDVDASKNILTFSAQCLCSLCDSKNNFCCSGQHVDIRTFHIQATKNIGPILTPIRQENHVETI